MGGVAQSWGGFRRIPMKIKWGNEVSLPGKNRIVPKTSEVFCERNAGKAL